MIKCLTHEHNMLVIAGLNPQALDCESHTLSTAPQVPTKNLENNGCVTLVFHGFVSKSEVVV